MSSAGAFCKACSRFTPILATKIAVAVRVRIEAEPPKLVGLWPDS